MNGRPWSTKDVDFLRANYPAAKAHDLAVMLHRSPAVVIKKLGQLGIRRTKPFRPAPEGFKWCYDCETEKPVSEFYAHRGAKDGLQPRCKQCSIAYAVAWNKANPDRFHRNARTHVLRKQYGLTHEQVAEIRARQDGRCAICREIPKRLCVDHDHATGRVRGLLCMKCNQALGAFGDSPTVLRRAARYVTTYY